MFGIKLKLERLFFIMAIIYASLIIEGRKKFKDVPKRIKEKVRQVLIDLDLEELTKDEDTEA